MNIKDQKIKILFEAYSEINQMAYKNIFLLSNIVLSKDPVCSNILELYLKNENIKQKNILQIILKIGIFYFLNVTWLFIHSLKWVTFKISNLRYELPKNAKELILIDNYFQINKILDNQIYQDTYFPGLENIFKKRKKQYVYIPFFIGSLSPIRFYKMLNILKKAEVPLLAEYQLLKYLDLLDMVCFIIIYPFHVLKLCSSIKCNNYENQLIKNVLLDNLHRICVNGFARYIFGKRLSELNVDRIKCISWCENQMIDKNLYKGLRNSHKKITIYGAQLLIYAYTHLNVNLDENEIVFGIVPDKILVNGKYYLSESNNIEYCLGPSLRYKRLLKIKTEPDKNRNILVILPYFKYEILNILEIITQNSVSKYEFRVKFHPTTNTKKYKKYLIRNLTMTQNDIYQEFKDTRMVIGVDSGALVEAASLSIPVVFVKNRDRLNHNPLPSYGMKIIWDQVLNSQQLSNLIHRYDNLNDKERRSISSIAADYRKMFFCEPCEKRIIEDFEL